MLERLFAGGLVLVGVVKQGRSTFRDCWYVGTFIKTGSNQPLILSILCIKQIFPSCILSFKVNCTHCDVIRESFCRGLSIKKQEHSVIILLHNLLFGSLVLAPTITYYSLFNIGAIILRPDIYNNTTIFFIDIKLVLPSDLT